MTKGDDTRRYILERAAELFNQQGYAGASMSDIMRVTGLQKGGIYNHFGSKEELALHAFDTAWEIVLARFRELFRGRKNTVDRLHALLDLFRDYLDDPPVRGGCPAMNTAIEADNTNPELRDRARQALGGWHEFIAITVQKGIARDEIKPDVDGDVLASLMISMLEGGVMLSMLYNNSTHLNRVLDYWADYLETQVRA